jgi:uridylate kinase
MTMHPAYRRVLLKLSGEAFNGDQKFGVEQRACAQVAQAIKQACDLGVQMGVVVGGGNIFRGSQAQAFGLARTPADHVGMLATVINGVLLQQSLSALGCASCVMSALPCGSSLVEPYSWKGALQALDQGRVVLFVGGTGSPYFTTDTAAALRASEMGADILLKATKVDGVYDKDPLKHPDAVRFPQLTYSDVLTKKLDVMDATAIALCRENRIPICVFNLFETEALLKALCRAGNGSLVTGESS